LAKRSHHDFGRTPGAVHAGQRASTVERNPRRGRNSNPAQSQRQSGGSELKSAANWMNFHDVVLMPARRRGGATEVRRVLDKALCDGVIAMNERELEQEVKDVMAAPDIEA